MHVNWRAVMALALLSACTSVEDPACSPDPCGVCDADPSNDCLADCTGGAGGAAYIDMCGACVGGSTGLLPCTEDCAGTWGGNALLDRCGACAGGTTGQAECSLSLGVALTAGDDTP